MCFSEEPSGFEISMRHQKAKTETTKRKRTKTFSNSNRNLSGNSKYKGISYLVTHSSFPLLRSPRIQIYTCTLKVIPLYHYSSNGMETSFRIRLPLKALPNFEALVQPITRIACGQSRDWPRNVEIYLGLLLFRDKTCQTNNEDGNSYLWTKLNRCQNFISDKDGPYPNKFLLTNSEQLGLQVF